MEIVKCLLGRAPVRVAVRTLATARNSFAEQAGLEFVAFDFLDTRTFHSAFAGIDRMFLVRPPHLANVERDIAPALIAARQAGIHQIVFLSLQGVENNRVVPHYKIEQTILRLGFQYTFLRAGFFMQNLSTIHRAEIRNRSEIAVPVGKARTSFMDVRDIGAVGAEALLSEQHVDQRYTLTGSEALDYYQVADILSTALGRTIRYTNPSPLKFVVQNLRQGQPLGFTMIMAGLYTITRFGNASEVSHDVQKVLNREPILFRQFATDFRECWMPEKSL